MLTAPSRAAGPLQAQVRDRIAEMIADGTLAPGAALPPFRELARQLGTSVTPLHRAIRELAAAGLVEVRQGSGVRVAVRRAVPAAADAQRAAPPTPRASGTVAVFSRIAPGHDDNRWKHRMVTAFEQAVGARGHRVRFFNQCAPDGTVSPLLPLIREAVAGGADAVALIEAQPEPESQEAVWDLLQRSGRPHVFVSGGAHRGPLNSVYYDSDWAGFLAARHACQQGYRRVAMPLFAPEDWGDAVRAGEGQGWIAERFAGAARACRRYGAEMVPLCVAPADLGDGIARAFPHAVWPRSGEVTAERVLGLLGGDMPTALLALNDEMAVAAIGRLRENGVAVPEDVAVIGFDNREEGRAFQLTTVEPPLEELGREAALLLDRLLAAGPPAGEHESPIQHILVKPTLVVRGTVPKQAS